MSKLVGINCVEHYFPNRVAAQFGLIQDVVPCHVNRNNLSKEEAWDEYNKPLDELTLYIPSRCVIPWLKKSSSDWWKKLFPKENQAVESAESLTQRNIIGDDDTSDSVPSGCKRWKSMKQLCEDDEDDSLTIAQVMRLRKKNTMAMCSSDENYSSDLPKVLLLSELLKKLGDGFPEKLKRSRTTRTVMRSEINIGDCGGSAASTEVPLGDLFDKELVKRKSECLGKKRAREDDDESGMDCYDDVTNGDGTKEAKCFLHEDGGDKHNDTDENLKQRNNAIEELALTLEARMMKVEKTLAKIREWKTIEIKGAKNGVSA